MRDNNVTFRCCVCVCTSPAATGWTSACSEVRSARPTRVLRVGPLRRGSAYPMRLFDAITEDIRRRRAQARGPAQPGTTTAQPRAERGPASRCVHGGGASVRALVSGRRAGPWPRAVRGDRLALTGAELRAVSVRSPCCPRFRPTYSMAVSRARTSPSSSSTRRRPASCTRSG